MTDSLAESHGSDTTQGPTHLMDEFGQLRIPVSEYGSDGKYHEGDLGRTFVVVHSVGSVLNVSYAKWR